MGLAQMACLRLQIKCDRDDMRIQSTRRRMVGKNREREKVIFNQTDIIYVLLYQEDKLYAILLKFK